uniref:Uncharacterized protein n=1 Tax=Glossina austeni TaxID=7395 RepID=A0A1A9UNF2_GLOAU
MADRKMELSNGECDKTASCNKTNQIESIHLREQEKTHNPLLLNCIKTEDSNKLENIHESRRKRLLPNRYHKHMLLEHMKNYGCDVENLLVAIRNFKVPKEELLKQLNSSVKEAENYVYQECDSLSFQNINLWLEYLKKINAPEHCHYEAGVVLNAIANNENHPNPGEIKGIDLKAVYTFLSNASFGLPQAQLDSISSTFLIEEIENLINEANTEEGDRDICKLIDDLEAQLSSTNPGDPTSSLNPLKFGYNSDIKKM